MWNAGKLSNWCQLIGRWNRRVDWCHRLWLVCLGSVFSSVPHRFCRHLPYIRSHFRSRCRCEILASGMVEWRELCVTFFWFGFEVTLKYLIFFLEFCIWKYRQKNCQNFLLNFQNNSFTFITFLINICLFTNFNIELSGVFF